MQNKTIIGRSWPITAVVIALCLIQGCSKDPVAHEIQRLQDNNGDVRKAAANVLGESNDPRAIRTLITVLGDARLDVRSAAELALIKFGTPVKEPSGINITDGNWKLFDLTLRPFVTKPVFIDEFVSNVTITALLTTPRINDTYLREEAAKVLAMIPNPRIEKLLATTLKEDERSAVRVVAVEALGEMKDPCAIDLLIAAINDRNETVRQTAVLALGKIGDPRAVEPLIACLNGPAFYGIQEAAWRALAKMGVKGVLSNSIGMKLVWIPPGEFLMGSPTSEIDRDNDEDPQHCVHITQGFGMGVNEVTQAQYTAVMGNNPSYFKGSDLPVEGVSWKDATEFCRRLSQKEGKIYRLPTEAQWEYACRAGTSTPFSFGETISTYLANYNSYYTYGSGSQEQCCNKTMPVGSFKPNAFGLYDMHGNIYEWCQDWYGNDYYVSSPKEDPKGPKIGSYRGSYRVLRGGSWSSAPWVCRSAFRSKLSADYSGSDSGFRVVYVSED